MPDINENYKIMKYKCSNIGSCEQIEFNDCPVLLDFRKSFYSVP